MRDTCSGWLHKTIEACCLALWVACVLGWSASAHAEPELQLTWTVPEGESCPDRLWAEQRIREQLGRDPSGEVQQGVLGDVKIARAQPQLALHLTIRDGTQTGERTIEGTDCRELSEAALLIVALSVAEARDRAAPPPPAKPSVATPAPLPETKVAVLKAAPAGALALRLDGLIEHGLLAPLGGGAQLALSYQRDWWAAELAGTWLATGTRRGELRSDAQGNRERSRVDLGLWAGRALGCAFWRKSRWQLGPCSGVELGAVLGRGARSPQTTSERGYSLWAAGLLAARLSFDLVGRWLLVLSSEHLLRLTHLRFVTVDPGGEAQLAFRAPRYQTRATLGVQVRF